MPDDDYLDEADMWTPQGKAVPPVLGRFERGTGKPLMHYDDNVEEAPEKKDDFDDGWEDENGSAIDISF